MKTIKTDVLVCGGRCAGSAAALASARSGAKTLLIERAGFAGGIITAVGLPYFDGLIDKPTGRFVVGGPQGDCGLTGRKIIVDSYGGMGRHGGGAFSGKDPTKVDRSAAYMARWVAKHIVASGAAERCELQVAYAIGHPEPTSIHLDTFGTGEIPDEQILAAVKKVFLFNPAEIIRQLDLRRPIYRASTHYGHFGKKGLPWEITSKLPAFHKALIK